MRSRRAGRRSGREGALVGGERYVLRDDVLRDMDDK